MIYSEDVARKVAKYLLETEAVKLQPSEPFLWSKGWKSPIYCDNRSLLSFPEVRAYLKEQFAALVTAQFSQVDIIAGVATAGIPWGALIADQLGLPMCYVRSKPKTHGTGQQIEGRLEGGQKVVVVEDLISTGGSSLAALDPLYKAGAEVLAVVAIFTYGFPEAEQNFKEAQVPYITLSNYEHLLPVALEQGLFGNDVLEVLQKWRQSPETWKGVS